ncbi:MAG: hypothetical protein J6I97_03055, partial [Agathobacter sp.]|nr:hypothetical protein [Agathobacter sp.]
MVITYDDYLKRKKKRQKEESKDGVISLERYAELNDLDLSSIRRASAPQKEVETTITLPIKEEEKKDEKWYDGWFQESEGNLLQTVVGSGADLLEKAGSGILGMGEGILDGLMTMQPYFTAGQNVQYGGNLDINELNQSKANASSFIQKDLYDEQTLANQLVGQNLKKTTGIDTETMSVFGEKSDALAQSAGQLVGQLGLNALGVPWFVTSGLSSGGAEAENALNQGATLDEAFGSGLISAGAEILTEKISGGIKFGGKTLDEAWVKPLTENISNSALRTLSKIGFDAAGEGAEEVISQIFSNLGSALYREED